MKSHSRATAASAALRIQGEALGRSELAGTRVTVCVEEFEAGAIDLPVDGPIEATFALPPEIRERPFVNVRLVSDDFAYLDDLSHPCVVFRLRRRATE